MKIKNHIETLETGPGLSIHNLMLRIRNCLKDSEIRNGFVVVSSRHTTTAITINEDELRLLKDIDTFFSKLVPADDKYLHNDLHLRDCPPDEPENAHSHLIAMLTGSSEAIPVVDGELALGQYQSVMLLDLDGARTRTVNIQVVGE